MHRPKSTLHLLIDPSQLQARLSMFNSSMSLAPRERFGTLNPHYRVCLNLLVLSLTNRLRTLIYVDPRASEKLKEHAREVLEFHGEPCV